MKTMKVLALVYSPEDKKKMNDWSAAAGGACEIVAWSGHLDVPLQSAVAHFCEAQDIDGLLIDDHQSYDSIVMKRVEEYVRIAGLNLYSATASALPIYGYAESTVASTTSNVFSLPSEVEFKSVIRRAV
jgi:hypothetical protein